MRLLITSALVACVLAAEQPAWAQCGGQGYTGGTSCKAGNTCVLVNQWYSQCRPSSGAPSMTTTTKTPPSPTASSTNPPASVIRYLGRVNPATKELTWPGTGLTFSFTGTTATINLAAVNGANSIDLSIDGGSPTVISNVVGPSISTPKLSQGNHTVTLRKRSETELGTLTIDKITTDGTFNPPSAAPSRQIEIIGDSISVGYGLDGTNPCPNNAAVENNPKTYGALAAKALGADYSAIAWSGKGLIRNIAIGTTDTSPLTPELYTRYGANDASGSYTFPSTWTPDAVVINLGTNDFNYFAYTSTGQSYKARDALDPAAYTAGMVKFVKSIQGHYPDAHFFLMNSPMLSDSYPSAADAQKTTQTNAIKAAITQLKSEKVHFVDWPSQGADVGCDYHPNAATNAAEGKVLAGAIGAALGW